MSLVEGFVPKDDPISGSHYSKKVSEAAEFDQQHSIASTPTHEQAAVELILPASDEESNQPSKESLSLSTTPAEVAQTTPPEDLTVSYKDGAEVSKHLAPTQVSHNTITEKATNGLKKPKESSLPSKLGVKKDASKPLPEAKKTPASGALKAPIRSKLSVATASSVAKRVNTIPAKAGVASSFSTSATRNNAALRKPVVNNSNTAGSLSKPGAVPTRKPVVSALTDDNSKPKRTTINARPAVGANRLSKATSGVSASRATASRSPVVKEMKLSLNGTRHTNSTANPVQRKLKASDVSFKPIATTARKVSELEKQNLELQEYIETQSMRIANLESATKLAEEKISWFETRLAQADALNQRQAQAESGFVETIKGLEAQLDSERRKQQELAALAEAQLAETSSKLELIKVKASESEQWRDAHQAMLSEQTRKLHELESQHKALNEQHTARINERDQKLASTEAALATSRLELEQARATVLETQKALEQTKNSQAEEIVLLKRKLAEAEEAASRLKAESEALKASMGQEVKNLTSKLEMKIVKASNEAKQHEEKSRQLMSTVEELKKSFDLAQKDIQTLQNSIKERDALVEARTRTLASTEETVAQHHKLRKEHEDLKLKFAESKEAGDKLQAAQEQIRKLQREKEEASHHQESSTQTQHALAKLAQERDQLADKLIHKGQEVERLKQEQQAQAQIETRLREALAASQIKQVEAAALESEFKKLQDQLKASRAIQEELAKKNMALLQNLADRDEAGTPN